MDFRFRIWIKRKLRCTLRAHIIRANVARPTVSTVYCYSFFRVFVSFTRVWNTRAIRHLASIPLVPYRRRMALSTALAYTCTPETYTIYIHHVYSVIKSPMRIAVRYAHIHMIWYSTHRYITCYRDRAKNFIAAGRDARWRYFTSYAPRTRSDAAPAYIRVRNASVYTRKTVVSHRCLLVLFF